MKIITQSGFGSIIHRIFFAVLAFGGFGYIFYKGKVFVQGTGSFIVSFLFMLWLFWVIYGQASALYVEDKNIRIKSFFGLTHVINSNDIIGFTGSTFSGYTTIAIIAITYYCVPVVFIISTNATKLAERILAEVESMSGKRNGVLYLRRKRHNV